MVFLQPFALLLLAAAFVPPLLHLFQRRRPPDVEFPAVRYLRDTEREAQRTLRLRHLLLMLLRVLALVLIALAASQPVVPARIGAGHAPTALALVLDNSLSSGAVSGGVRALDDLAARARETLRAARPADALWLIDADGVPRRGTAAELLAAVDAAAPEPARLDLSAAVAAAARLVRASRYPHVEVHLLSDVQRTAFGAPDSAAAGVPLLVYHPAADPPPNRAVIAARATPATWLAGAGGAVAVTIGGEPAPRGGGGGSGPGVAVAVSLAGRAGPRMLVAPRDVALLPVTAPRAGWTVGEASLEPDELRADDRRPFVVRVVAPALVAAAPAGDLGPFVAEALGALARAGQLRLGTGPGAVRLGPTAPPPGAAGVVLPPADPLGLGPANRALAAAGVPWRFGPRIAREDTIAAPQLPEVNGARVLRRYQLEAVPGPGARGVLARAGGDPWLVRWGRIVVVASRLVPEETGLPLTSRFVPFVGALVNRLARGEEGVLAATPGSPVTLPDDVTGLAPGGATPPAAGPGPAVQPVEGGTIAAPSAPGVDYLLAAGDTVGALVVATDPRESDLRRATRAEIDAAFPGARVTVAGSARSYAAARYRGAGRTELTGWLLAAALVTLLVEALVASGAVAHRETR
jgi:Aerotolerance regulator N-terminal